VGSPDTGVNPAGILGHTEGIQKAWLGLLPGSASTRPLPENMISLEMGFFSENLGTICINVPHSKF